MKTNRLFSSLGALVTSVTFLAAVHAHAAPTLYNINFVLSSGTPGAPAPTSGTFLYDPAGPAFSSFSVIWNGISFDLTSSANSPSVIGACATSAPDVADVFEMLRVGCAGDSREWSAIIGIPFAQFSFTSHSLGSETEIVAETPISRTLPPASASGTWSIAATVPEPTSLSLMAAGIFGLGAYHCRRRIREKRQTYLTSVRDKFGELREPTDIL